VDQPLSVLVPPPSIWSTAVVQSFTVVCTCLISHSNLISSHVTFLLYYMSYMYDYLLVVIICIKDLDTCAMSCFITKFSLFYVSESKITKIGVMIRHHGNTCTPPPNISPFNSAGDSMSWQVCMLPECCRWKVSEWPLISVIKVKLYTWMQYMTSWESSCRALIQGVRRSMEAPALIGRF